MRFARIPEELKLLRQWVCWQAVSRDGKVTKAPFNAATGSRASITNRSDWCSFDEAVAALAKFPHFSGIGFVFVEGGPYVGIDLDKSSDPQVWEYHSKIYNATRSYTERSPSGNGAHIIVRARMSGSGRRNTAVGVEVYGGLRYFTMTGNRVEDGRCQIEDGQELVDWLLRDMGGGGGNAAIGETIASGPATDSDGDILNRIRAGGSAARFEALFNGAWAQRVGDPPGVGYGSQSDADQAIFNIIAQYTQNHEQIIRIFHASALGKREKAYRADYIQRTLKASLDRHVSSEFKDKVAPALAKAHAAMVERQAAGAFDLPRHSPIYQIGHAPGPICADPATAIEAPAWEDIIPEDVDWLWRNWLARGMLHILGGQPGIGKSTLMLSVAANLSVGGYWPDGTRPPRPAKSLIWTDEDSVKVVLRPRVEQMGLDPETGAIGPRRGGIRFLNRTKDPVTNQMRDFMPSQDMPLLIEHLAYLREHKNWVPDVLFLDPINALQRNKKNNNPNDSVAVGEAFQVLNLFAEKSGCAIVGLAHVAKNSKGSDPIDRIVGSVGYIGKPRIGWMAEKNIKHEEDPNEAQGVLTLFKHNIGRGADCGWCYDIKDGPIPVPEKRENGAIFWREEWAGSAREIIKDAQTPSDEEGVQTKAQEARAWLDNQLPPMGERPAKDILADGRAAGFTDRAIQRAAQDMVNKRRDGHVQGWMWSRRLPPPAKGKPRR